MITIKFSISIPAYLCFLCFVLPTYSLNGQIITAEPSFPTDSDELTITFDATQGTGGLADCNCAVYLHTGVITNLSTGPSDWRYVSTTWGEANPSWKMTQVAGQPNLYQYTFSPNLRQYFGVSPEETIEKLALVFRNGDGSLEGKGIGGSDIFYDIAEEDAPLTATFLNPLDSHINLALGETLTIQGAVSRDAEMSLLIDGHPVIQESNVSSLSYTYTTIQEGLHTALLVAEAEGERSEVSFSFYVSYQLQLDEPVYEVVELASSGGEIVIQAHTFVLSDYKLYIDGALSDQASGSNFSLNKEFVDPGVHEVTLISTHDGLADTAAFAVLVPPYTSFLPPPINADLGVTYLHDHSILLQLYAPGKDHVFVLGDFNDWTPRKEFFMQKNATGDGFWLQIDSLIPGQYYAFQYLVDGKLRVADPHSTLVLDDYHDQFISEETWPGLPEFPDGSYGRATLIQPGATRYDWQINDFDPPAQEKLVIYELLLRDFLHTHNYQTLVDTLDYLDRLGINAIELMPVSEFEANISWGYNPSFHQALDKYYGTPTAFKRFVDACHERGIAVILDVVYNHAFGQSPLVRMWWDDERNRPAPDNPYANVQARHPFNVGFDLNHEHQATKNYFEQVMRYWLNEYRVDGFRFDLSKGFTQNNTGGDVGAWGNYDASRIAILKHYADVVWSANPDAYVILEHFADLSEENELTTYKNGMLSWAGFGPHNAYLNAAMGYSGDLNLADYQQQGRPGPDAVVYMESHDEERMVYKNLLFGNQAGDYNIKDIITALQRVELASIFFFTQPGPKMIWQFEELGYPYSINTCRDLSVDAGCRLDLKPINWDYVHSPNRQRIFRVMQSMIELRKTQDVFHTDQFTVSGNGSVKKIWLDHLDNQVVALGNFGVIPLEAANPFPEANTWYEFFSGDSMVVIDASAPLMLMPGEYRLYSRVPMGQPAGGTITAERALDMILSDVQLFPNPAGEKVNLLLSLSEAASIQVQLLDVMGRPCHSQHFDQLPIGKHYLELDTMDLENGVYMVRLQIGNSIVSRKLMVVR